MSKIFYVSLLTFLFVPIMANGQIYLTQQTIDDACGGPSDIHVSDIDGDGDPDIVGAEIYSSDIVWWSNDGGEPLSWTKQVIDGLFGGAITIYASDINGDGFCDVVGGGWNNAQIAWWKNDGNFPITWTKEVLSNDFTHAHEVFACDINDDGDTDILGAAAEPTNQIVLWENLGGDAPQWIAHTITTNFDGARSVYAIDVDGDGDKDIIGSASNADDIHWWRNDGGTPIQWTEFIIDNNFAGIHQIYPCDVDSDGLMDVTGTSIGNQVAWWRNDGSDPIQWTRQIIDDNFNWGFQVFGIDMDNDGDLDVASTADEGYEVAWWSNDGGNPIQWTKHTIVQNFSGAWPLYGCDLDQNGFNDIIAGATDDRVLAWWKNLGDNYVVTDFEATPLTGHAPLDISFSDLSNASPEIINWEWDFDSDGTVDSEGQNPTWSYIEPGVYTVTLKTSNATGYDISVKEAYVTVFNGESALLFDGEESYALCPPSPSLDLIDVFTVEAWIKPYGWGEMANIGFGTIIDKSKVSAYLIGTTPGFNDNSLVLQIVHSDGVISKANTPVNSIVLDEWQHIAATYDGVGEVKVFINGEEQSLSQMPQPSGGIADNSNYDLLIGTSQNHNWTFDGIIDEVRLWNRTFSQQEIETNKDYHLSGSEVNLIAYWEMNEAYGDTILDGLGENDASLFTTSWIQGKVLNPTFIDENSALVMFPSQFKLFANYPNPFNPSTTIQFEIPVAQQRAVKLQIYDVSGMLIKTLIDKPMEAGYHSIFWDGKNEAGQDIASGVYFYRLEGKNFNGTKSMILLK